MFLLTIPSIAFYSPAQASTITIPDTKSFIETREMQEWPLNDPLLSYDNILNFINSLEIDDLESKYSAEELEKITNFLITLAREGILPDGTDSELILENDIEELLNNDDDFNEHSFSFYLDDGGYLIIPAVSSGHENIILCSWIKKVAKKIKKFIKEHKTEVIVGVLVVVAVVAVVVTAGAAAPAIAPAAAAAGGAAALPESDNKNKSEAKKEEGLSSSTHADANAAPDLKEVLEDQISSFKELVVEDNLLQNLGNSQKPNDPSFREKARDLGAFLAHEALAGVSEIASFSPQLLEEIKDIGSRILPESSLPKNDLILASPMENYDQLITTGHKKIDQIFSTEQADFYTREAKDHYDFTIGVMPPPGLLSTTSIPNAGRILPTQASNVIGWTVGQPISNLTKSGNVPKWTTVRGRHWKNLAELAKSDTKILNHYGAENIQRMEKGLAPQRFNKIKGKWESMELHHNPAQRDGGLFDFIEVWPDEHALIDTNRHLGN